MPENEPPACAPLDIRPDEHLSREYRGVPSIQNYLSLRKAFPEKQIEFATTGGIECLIEYEVLFRDQGINLQLIFGTLEANHDAISKLSLLLLEKISDREELHQAGETHIRSLAKNV